jgi:eukaryotic-like serine/threonine-protein kinase
MEKKTKRLYEFGRFRLDPDEMVLLLDGKPFYLKPKLLETLLVLVQDRGRILDKDTLMRRLWQDAFVEEANLTVNISALRKALRQSEGGEQFIETVPRRGYRFVADVQEVLLEDTELVISEYATTRITIVESDSSGEELPAPLPELEPPDASREREADILPRALDASRGRRRKITVSAAIVLAIGVLIGATWLYRFVRRQPADRLQTMSITRLTTVGKVTQVAISPDGKYVAYVVKDGDKQSLWVSHVPTSSNITIVPPAEVLYQGLAFTPDGNHIDFVKAEKNSAKGSLYQIAVLGGAAKKLFDDLASAVSFSPDGSRIVFLRGYPSETVMVIANADGSDEQKLASRNAPDSYEVSANGPSWSPDGHLIACFAMGHNEKTSYSNVVLLRSGDGVEEKIYPTQWLSAEGLAWCPDGSGLLIAASDDSATYQQIWHLSYPGGALQRITNDVHGYVGIGTTADSRALITMQRNVVSSIWVAPNGDARQARQISSGTFDGRNGFSWMPDGRIVYTSRMSGTKDIDLWIMDADGGNTRQLTIDSGMNYAPSVSSDGRSVVFVSNRSGNFGVWTMDIDGENQKQLTSGFFDFEPQCTPDGKWVVFVREDSGKPMVWKVPFEGGTPVRLADGYSISPAISPDGKLVACNYVKESEGAVYRTALIPIDGGPPLKFFDLPPDIVYQSFIHWTPDGRALTYAGIRGNAKVWLQSLEGGPPKELTDFRSDSIWYFDWSRDGKQLACSRGGSTSDVVLMRDFR